MEQFLNRDARKQNILGGGGGCSLKNSQITFLGYCKMLLNEELNTMKIYVNFNGPVPTPLQEDVKLYVQDIANLQDIMIQ